MACAIAFRNITLSNRKDTFCSLNTIVVDNDCAVVKWCVLEKDVLDKLENIYEESLYEIETKHLL